MAVIFGILISCSGTKRDLSEEQALLQEGKNIAGMTFTELSTKLQFAVSQGGVNNALTYCNVNASPLVDSLSQLHNASIARRSENFRNPENKPNEIELKAIQDYRKAMSEGEELTPSIVTDPEGGKYFFAPIQLNDFCLKCHGKPNNDIAAENMIKIKELYPEDLATGYAIGELRGIWSIKFK